MSTARARRRSSARRSAALLRRVVPKGRIGRRSVTRHQDVRWTYAELLRRSEDLAIGLQALGLAEGRSRRHLVGQRQRVGAGAVRHGARRADPRQHQSRLPRPRIRIRDEEVRLPGADPEPRPQEQRLFRLAARLRARDRRGPAGQALVQRPAEARDRHPPGDRQDDGDAQLRRRRETRRAGRTGRRSRPSKRRCSSTIRSTSSSPPAPPARRRARR